MKTLFLFRRDLRLEDNTGLIAALQASELVIPAFILTPEQIEDNPYRSDYCLQFMLESLKDLDAELKEKGSRLYLFQGKPEEIVEKIIRELHIGALFVNRDYTPYSIRRDERLEKVCQRHQILFRSFDDALLIAPEDSLKKDGTPYTLFTPYFRNAMKEKVKKPTPNRATHYFRGKISFEKGKSLLSQIQPNSSSCLKGGRKEALKILKNLKAYRNYDSLKDYPAENGSTHLSAYLKFTVCSPREVYAALCHHLDKHHDLIRSLYWRDFFTTIEFFFPHVFQGPFRPQFTQLKWVKDKKLFHRWCKGMTGFPLVDAGMREMNETGFMHNRVRMITASFLIKDLHIDWRWGEKYFAQTLIDYDPAVNNGNWQWVASTGCDAQPYFRIFNPWSQQKKFDPDCRYIKKWVPELRDLPPEVIHNWHREKHHPACPNYPPPLLDHEKQAKKALAAFRAART